MERTFVTIESLDELFHVLRVNDQVQFVFDYNTGKWYLLQNPDNKTIYKLSEELKEKQHKYTKKIFEYIGDLASINITYDHWLEDSLGLRTWT